MPDFAAQDRLQPSLLDRLIDEDRRSTVEPIEARVLTRQQLRAAVLRDLSWLFNATQIKPDAHGFFKEELRNWDGLDEAARSVVNFGLPAFSGETLSSLDLSIVEQGVREAIQSFEPRIDPSTLNVEISTEQGIHHNCMRLVIKGQMWNQPVPLELLLAADVDVENGSTSLKDLRS